MVATLLNVTPDLSTLQKLTAEFRRGIDSFEDEPRSRCPESATTEKKKLIVFTILGCKSNIHCY